MGTYSAISDISESLKKILQDALDTTFPPAGTVTVTLDSPKRIEEDSRTQDSLLSVFLYRTIQNVEFKNQPPVSSTYQVITPPPLVIDLHYMLTAYGVDEPMSQRIQGRAQQIMFATPNLQGAALLQTLAGSQDQIRITLNPLGQDMVSQIWQALEASMRLSAFYLFTPVLIELPDLPAGERVRRRDTVAP